MQQNNTSTDTELVALLRRNPDVAMQRIFETYYQEVCKHIYRLIPVRETCEDITQSIFLELWKKRREFEIHTSIGAYLHKMALSRALNYIRDNRKHRHDAEDDLSAFEEGGSNPLQQLTDRELQGIMQQAIDALPARCRHVFMLSRFEGLSYQEISRELDISPKTVENQISKALLMLRSALHKYHGGKQE